MKKYLIFDTETLESAVVAVSPATKPLYLTVKVGSVSLITFALSSAYMVSDFAVMLAVDVAELLDRL